MVLWASGPSRPVRKMGISEVRILEAPPIYVVFVREIGTVGTEIRIQRYVMALWETA